MESWPSFLVAVVKLAPSKHGIKLHLLKPYLQLSLMSIVLTALLY